MRVSPRLSITGHVRVRGGTVVRSKCGAASHCKNARGAASLWWTARRAETGVHPAAPLVTRLHRMKWCRIFRVGPVRDSPCSQLRIHVTAYKFTARARHFTKCTNSLRASSLEKKRTVCAHEWQPRLCERAGYNCFEVACSGCHCFEVSLSEVCGSHVTSNRMQWRGKWAASRWLHYIQPLRLTTKEALSTRMYYISRIASRNGIRYA